MATYRAKLEHPLTTPECIWLKIKGKISAIFSENLKAIHATVL
jgi:hypothetical protein